MHSQLPSTTSPAKHRDGNIQIRRGRFNFGRKNHLGSKNYHGWTPKISSRVVVFQHLTSIGWIRKTFLSLAAGERISSLESALVLGNSIVERWDWENTNRKIFEVLFQGERKSERSFGYSERRRFLKSWYIVEFFETWYKSIPFWDLGQVGFICF